MIFQAKKKYDPWDGCKRNIKLFALFPRRCENDHYHWLEYVEILQKWVRGEGWISVVSEGRTAFTSEFPCICNIKEKE